MHGRDIENEGIDILDSVESESYIDSLSYIEQVFYLPTSEKDKTVFVFSAYFDESGTHKGSPCVVIAGYVSKVSQWAEFTREWQEVLDEYNLKHFHMTDFLSREHKTYKSLDKTAKDRLLSKLVAIINRRVHKGFGVTLDCTR